MAREPRMAVVICTLGRGGDLAQMIDDLADQTRPPQRVIVSTPRPDRLVLSERLPSVVVEAPLGLTKQRNAALDALTTDIDLVAFLDDDMVPAADYLEQSVLFLRAHPEVVLLSGNVLADGVRQGGLSRPEARRVLDASSTEGWWRAARRAYGGTMVVRRTVAQAVRFDARLVGYGWLEDRDFGYRCSRLGEVGYYGGCRIVHLGQESGTSSAVRFGFAQIVNPCYLWSKGSMSLARAVWFVLRATLRNAVAWATRDRRRGRDRRFRGNLLGWRQLMSGRIDPEGVEALED